MSPRLKMLFLSEEFPLPVASGSNLRQMNLLKSFAADFDVTLLTIATRPCVDHLEELRARVHRLLPVVPMNKRSLLHRALFKALYWLRRLLWAESPERFYTTLPNVRSAIQHELHSQTYDVVFCCLWYWPREALDAEGLTVIDTNDVHWQRTRLQLQRTSSLLDRLLAARLVSRYRRLESAALRRADLVVAITEADRREFERLCPGALDQVVIPTGLDAEYFAPQQSEPIPNQIAFYGSLSNPMNRDALVHLRETILPRIRQRIPDVRLTLIGAWPSQEAHDLVARHAGVDMTGYVPDIREPLAKAAVVILPLRFAHGIRGRVFEVMSMGIPIVATSVAVDGMGLAQGEGLLIADAPEDFAAAVEKLLTDRDFRDEISDRGRRFVRDHLSFESTYDRLRQLLVQRCHTTPRHHATPPE